MSRIKADTTKLEKLISDLNSYSLNFKNHVDHFNDLLLKTESCWQGDVANEYRSLANAFNKTENEAFYLTLSNLIERLSILKTELDAVINSNKGD